MTTPSLRIDPTVAERSGRLEDTRGHDATGHYELLLPLRFRPVDLPPQTPNQETSPARVALFQTLEGPFAEVEITGLFLRREIAPADVLESLLGPDQEVVESRRVPSPGGDQLDVLTRRNGPVPTLTRWWTVKDGGAQGGRVYLLEARARADQYAQVAPELETMLASFRLLNPTDWDYNERLKPFSRRAPNDIVFFYPESWQRRDETTDGSLIANFAQEIGGRFVGRLTVCSETGEPDAMDRIARYAETLGAPVDWAPIEEVPAFAGLERGWRRRGRTSMDGAIADVRVEVAQGEGGTHLIAIAGTATREDQLVAATLRRTLQVVRDTYRVAGVAVGRISEGQPERTGPQLD